MSRLEQVRVRISDTSTVFNQRTSRDILERRKRVSGSGNRKAQKSRDRIAQIAQDKKFVRDWINRQSELNLDPKQRFDLALKRGDNSDTEFLLNHLDDIERFGYRVDISCGR